MHTTFFAVEDDLRELLRQADGLSLGVLPATYRVGHEPKLEGAMHFQPGDAAFLLLPREFSLGDVVYIPGSKGKAGTATVDLEESPAILFAPSVLWGTKLDAGHIEMADEVPNHRFSLTERKYSFLSQTMRRWQKTDKNQGFVGPATAKLVREQRIQLGLGKKAIGLW